MQVLKGNVLQWLDFSTSVPSTCLSPPPASQGRSPPAFVSPQSSQVLYAFSLILHLYPLSFPWIPHHHFFLILRSPLPPCPVSSSSPRSPPVRRLLSPFPLLQLWFQSTSLHAPHLCIPGKLLPAAPPVLDTSIVGSESPGETISVLSVMVLSATVASGNCQKQLQEKFCSALEPWDGTCSVRICKLYRFSLWTVGLQILYSSMEKSPASSVGNSPLIPVLSHFGDSGADIKLVDVQTLCWTCTLPALVDRA